MKRSPGTYTFACHSLFLRRSLFLILSLSPSLSYFLINKVYVYISFYSTHIPAQHSRSRPFNNRCPENWFVTQCLHARTHPPSLSLSSPFFPFPPFFSLTLSLFVSSFLSLPPFLILSLFLRFAFSFSLILSLSRPCVQRNVEFTPRFVWSSFLPPSSPPSPSLLHRPSSRCIRPHVSADICFIVFHVLFEINNTPASVPFFHTLFAERRGTRRCIQFHVYPRAYPESGRARVLYAFDSFG